MLRLAGTLDLPDEAAAGCGRCDKRIKFAEQFKNEEEAR
jgi:hypothetical protein